MTSRRDDSRPGSEAGGTDRSRRGTDRTRRGFVRAAAGLGAASLAGCFGFGGNGGGPTVRLLTVDGYQPGGVLDTLEEHVDVELDTGQSGSERILQSWRDGSAAEEWDLAILGTPSLTELVATGDTASPPDDLENAPERRDLFQRLGEGILGSDGDQAALPIAGDWLGYGYDERSLEGHAPSLSVPFTESVDGVDLTGAVLMSEESLPSILAIAGHLGLEEVFAGEEWSLSADQQEAIRDAGTDQFPLVYDYSGNPTGRWETVGDAVEVGVVTLNATIAARAEGEEWPTYATPENAVLTELDGVVVSEQADDPDAAWQVADALTHPDVGASISRYRGGVGVHPDVGEYVDDYVTPGADDESNPFQQPAADFVASIEDAAFDRLRPVKPVADRSAWRDLWSEIRSEAPSLPGDD